MKKQMRNKLQACLGYAVMLVAVCSVFTLAGQKAEAATSTKTKALKAYGAYLSENNDNYASFAVVDLNKDGVPEVITTDYKIESYGFMGGTVLSYQSGKVKTYNLESKDYASGIYYNASTKTYFLTSEGDSSLTYETIQFKNKKLTLTKSTKTWLSGTTEKYSYNKDAITFADYKSYMSKYYGYNAKTYKYSSKVSELKWYSNTVLNRLTYLKYIKQDVTRTSDTTTNSIKSGNTLYLSLPVSESNFGLCKIDLTTMKKTTLVTGKVSMLREQLVSELSKKGDYIYYTLDTGIGYYTCSEIHKINVKTNKTTKLANGKSAVIIGDWIYYIKVTSTDANSYEEAIGIYKMKLDGSKQTCVAKNSGVSRLRKSGNTLYADMLNGRVRKVNLKTGDLVSTGDTVSYYEQYVEKYNGYYYFVENGKFYKVNCETKKVATICTVKGDEMTLEVHSGVAVIMTMDDNYNCYYYLVDLKTKKKTLLKKC